jgi:hypothetical protein
MIIAIDYYNEYCRDSYHQVYIVPEGFDIKQVHKDFQKIYQKDDSERFQDYILTIPGVSKCPSDVATVYNICEDDDYATEPWEG